MKSISVISQKFLWNRGIAVSVITILLLALIPITSAFASELGYFAPTKAVSHGPGWSNPSNVLSSDDLYATATKNNKQLKLSNFNIPAIAGGATIDGLEIAVEGLTTGLRDIPANKFKRHRWHGHPRWSYRYMGDQLDCQ
jgi:hypothetical protein